MRRLLLIGSVIVFVVISAVCSFAADRPAAPEVSGVYYDYANDILHARGVSPEVQSDIDYYQYRVTKDNPEGAIIKDWTAITPMRYPVTLSQWFLLEAKGLNLNSSEIYYFSVRAARLRPMPAAPVYSDIVSVLIPMKDTTPPTAPVVNIISYDDTTDTLLVTGSSYDMESGVNRFEYKVTQGGTVIRDLTVQLPGIGSKQDEGFYAYTINAQGMNLNIGGTFSISVKAVNNDNLESNVISKSITVEGIVQPAAPEVSGVYYDYANNILHARGVSPAGSYEIDYYQYKIAKDSQEGTIIKDWTVVSPMRYPITLEQWFFLKETGLSLSSSEIYYFSVRAGKSMPMPSAPAYSDIVSVLIPMKDTTPPTSPRINIISYTADTDTLLLCGGSYDKESGVNRFEYKVTKGESIIRNWTSQLPGIGSKPAEGFYAYTINAQGMNLNIGGTFSISVKAVNNDGFESNVVSKNVKIAATPWKDNANGTLYTNVYWQSYTMGYRFVPNKNGKITQLGGYFNGTKTVYLWDANKKLIASVQVTSDNKWSYTKISPVQVTAGQMYTVAVYLPGPSQTGSYRYNIKTLPQTYGDITIKSSGFYYGGAECPSTVYTYVMYGQVDIGFVAD